MKVGNKILKKAAESLNRQTGLLIRCDAGVRQKDKDADYQMKVIVPLDGESKAIDYTAQIKTRISDAGLGNAAIQAKNLSGRLVLVSEYVPPVQAEKLRQLNISFFDTAGNAYFNASGVYVFVSGNKTKVSREKPLGLFRPAGIKLLLAFLIQPGLENADYRTLAADTGVPRTTIGELIADLEKAGYLARRGKRRFLLNKQELIKRWVEEYSEKFRIKLKPVRYRSNKLTGRWWENFDISEYKAVWGGETGGAMLTGHLKPQTATVYADSKLTRLQAINGLVKDEKGEIEILERFWKFGEIGNIAPPLVIYADLVATADERNLETAKLIYDKYLAPLAEENT